MSEKNLNKKRRFLLWCKKCASVKSTSGTAFKKHEFQCAKCHNDYVLLMGPPHSTAFTLQISAEYHRYAGLLSEKQNRILDYNIILPQIIHELNECWKAVYRGTIEPMSGDVLKAKSAIYKHSQSKAIAAGDKSKSQSSVMRTESSLIMDDIIALAAKGCPPQYGSESDSKDEKKEEKTRAPTPEYSYGVDNPIGRDFTSLPSVPNGDNFCEKRNYESFNPTQVLSSIARNNHSLNVTYDRLISYISDRCSYRSLSMLNHIFWDAKSNQMNATIGRYNFAKLPNSVKPLSQICGEHNWIEGVQFCLQYLGMPINYATKKTLYTLCHLASWSGAYELLNYLISNGASPDLLNRNQENAFQAAIYGWKRCEVWWRDWCYKINTDENLMPFRTIQGGKRGRKSTKPQLAPRFWFMCNVGTGLDVSGSSVNKTAANKGGPVKKYKKKGSDSSLERVSLVRVGSKFEFIPVSHQSDEYFICIGDNKSRQCIAVIGDIPSQSDGNSDEKSDDTSNVDINAKIRVALQPFDAANRSQLWRVETVATYAYDFGQNSYIGGISMHPILGNRNRRDRQEYIHLKSQYYRFLPVCFKDKYELCGFNEAIPAMVNEPRVCKRLGCLGLRKKASISSASYAEFFKGMFRFVFRSNAPDSPMMNPNIISMFSAYSKTVNVITDYWDAVNATTKPTTPPKTTTTPPKTVATKTKPKTSPNVAKPTFTENNDSIGDNLTLDEWISRMAAYEREDAQKYRSVVIPIPAGELPLIMGRNGTTISDIRHVSQATIIVEHREVHDYDENRMVEIKGKPRQIILAIGEMKRYLESV